MRCIIIFVGFSLCSNYLVTSDNIGITFSYVSKNPSVPIQNDIDVSEYKKYVAGLHFDKTVHRQRRSIWTTFINHITAVAETFYMKPLIAEGLDDVESFGKTFQNELNGNKKITNAMLSEDDGIEEELNKAKKKIEKELKGEDEVEKNIVKTKEEKLNDVRELINSLIMWHNEVTEMEEKFLEELQTEFKMKLEDLKDVYSKGSNLIEQQDVYKKHIAGVPELEDYVKGVVAAIRRWREGMKRIEERLPKPPLSGFTKKEVDEIGPKLAIITESNQNWFLGKGRSKFIEELSEDDDKFGLIKSNLKKGPKVSKKTKKIRENWRYVKKIHQLVENLEFELIGYIVNKRNDIEADDIMQFYNKGTNFIQKNKVYKQIVAKKPQLKHYVKEELDVIRSMHKELRKLQRTIPKTPKNIRGLTEEEIKEIEQKLEYYIDSNERWFKGEDKPHLIKQYS